jgi:S1-C subfamily serine protease
VYRAFGLLLALLVACGAPTENVAVIVPPVTVTADSVWDMQDRTVKIDVECSYGSGSGSGVYIDYRTIATAAHVADDDCQLFVFPRTQLVVLARDDENDVAILHAPYKDVQSLRPSEPWLGMPLVAIGYSAQIGASPQLQVTRGYLITKLPDTRYRTSASFWFGSSGGPVFDEQGGLVGLSVAGNVMGAGWYPDYVLPDQYLVTDQEHVYKLYLPLADRE